MQIDFFDPHPHEPIEPIEPALRSLIAGATRLDAAIAFVTKGGTPVLREFLNANRNENARLVASVRFPTDLRELALLAQRMPGRVFIHTGFKEPEEKGRDRGQFHSKVVLIERPGDERCILVGSHNWTQNAMQGHNLEAGIIIRCREGDPIVGETRRHIQSCIRRSEEFDPNRLRFYQTIQRDLHQSPPASPSEDFPGFEEMDALVIHAESGSDGALPNPLQLFIPLRDFRDQPFFNYGQRVLLFLYPPGTLFGQDPPKTMPTLFDGEITLVNTVRDAPVDQRAANCETADLEQPRIALLPAGSVPFPSGELSQVVIRLDRRGPEPLPLFHAAAQSPKLKLAVEYGEVDPDERDLSDAGSWNDDPPEGGRQRETTSPLRKRARSRFTAPQHLIVRAIIRVPSQGLYRRDIRQQLAHAMWGAKFVQQTDVPQVEFEDPDKAKVLNQYIYLVHYRFSREAMERLQTQRELF